MFCVAFLYESWDKLFHVFLENGRCSWTGRVIKTIMSFHRYCWLLLDLFKNIFPNVLKIRLTADHDRNIFAPKCFMLGFSIENVSWSNHIYLSHGWFRNCNKNVFPSLRCLTISARLYLNNQRVFTGNHTYSISEYTKTRIYVIYHTGWPERCLKCMVGVMFLKRRSIQYHVCVPNTIIKSITGNNFCHQVKRWKDRRFSSCNIINTDK